ncbi:transposase [Streptomyces sp. NPDC058770]|uniref:transposase n=1 Tax=Streptomyces sp. NPDC058770 TaxID=3346631 RepID=UPI0036801E86
MSRFPTPEHLVSWAKLCPRTIQSGAKTTTGPAGQGNPWLKGALGGGRQRRRPHRHLPRRPLPPHRQTPRPLQGPGRRRPLDTRHHLAPDQRPGRLLPGTRRRLASTPSQSRPQDPRPCPPAPGPRSPGHPRTRIRLTKLAPTSGPQAARMLPPALPNLDFPISIQRMQHAMPIGRPKTGSESRQKITSRPRRRIEA